MTLRIPHTTLRLPRRAAFLLACILALGSVGSVFAAGVIEGKLVNGTDPKIKPKGAEIDVIQLGGGGLNALKSAVTDGEGRFRIEGLPTSDPLLVRANYLAVNYNGRPTFDASGRAALEITVYETTAKFDGIKVEDVRLGFQIDGEHLRALESTTFVNETRPARTFTSPEGSFRFTKPEGLEQMPGLTVTAPGSTMPLQQSPLESADGKSYYTLFPLRPGKTSFEIQYTLPYHQRSYQLRKSFYRDVPSYQIGMSPHDMALAGPGLEKIHSEPKRNFAIFAGGAVKSGTELVWSFSGGTAQSSPTEETTAGESKIRPMQNAVGRHALVIGPLMLAVLFAILWWAHNSVAAKAQKIEAARARELRTRREKLLDRLASLDDRFDGKGIERRDYVRQREQWKRQLRRVAALLGKK